MYFNSLKTTKDFPAVFIVDFKSALHCLLFRWHASLYAVQKLHI